MIKLIKESITLIPTTSIESFNISLIKSLSDQLEQVNKSLIVTKISYDTCRVYWDKKSILTLKTTASEKETNLVATDYMDNVTVFTVNINEQSSNSILNDIVQLFENLNLEESKQTWVKINF